MNALGNFLTKSCIFISLKSAWLFVWCNYIQRTLAVFMGSILTSDLIAQIIGVQGPVKELVGNKWFNVILITANVLVFIRGHWPPSKKV